MSAKRGRRGKGKSAQEKKFTPSDGLIWGIHPVLEILRSSPRRLSELNIQQGRGGSRLGEIIALAREGGIKPRFVERLRIIGKAAEVHQGVVARCLPVELLSFSALLSQITKKQDSAPPVLLALDSIKDPHNLGAIIRSAVAAGVDGIMLTRDRSAPLGGTALKVSAGSISRANLCQVVNLAQSLKQLQEQGFWVVGASVAPDAASLYETELEGSLCLVIGSEEKGIRPLVARHCDQLVSIPMHGGLDSLNASVAAGVLLFEILRQRLS